MSLSNVLFVLLIGPLQTLFEIVFIIAYKLTENPGLSIIVLSLIMNFLLLPLYNRTDAIQLEAIGTEKKMRPEVSHIKKTFKGDEQFMMLQTCYRQHHYKPTDALKGISPLLLEIPFFMAAYNYLSGLALFNEAPFGPIPNLIEPDGMLVIGDLSINLLPILMTGINILSSLIYTKDAPFKTKIQLYGMAGLFLVLLYDSPSGLVLYWTLNNLFSLVKNIVLKFRKPKKVARILSSAAGIFLLAYVLLVHPVNSLRKFMLVVALTCGLQLPLVMGSDTEKKTCQPLSQDNKRSFFICCGVLTVLIGILIPSAVIASSPAEFMDYRALNPMRNLLYTFAAAFGMFLIWLPVFYLLSKENGKKMLELGVWLAAPIALANYMFFGSDYGTLSPYLRYLAMPSFAGAKWNLVMIVILAAAAVMIWKKKPCIIRLISGTMGLAIIVMSAVNLVGIQRGYLDTAGVLQNRQDKRNGKIITLDQSGKNVVIIMMDRAIGCYVPYIMNEKPELQNQFSGFTYYPNTISFGLATNVGTPALFGGYDYVPEEMNRRSNEALVNKQNEALKVLPVLFLKNGYQVTVGDPSYAGYKWIPDLSIYEEYPEITAFHSADFISQETISDGESNQWYQSGRTFFFYSLFRASPVVLQPSIYNGGKYNYVEHLKTEPQPHSDDPLSQYVGDQETEGLMKAKGIYSGFYKNYKVLSNLPKMTMIENSGKNTFLMMTNNATHEPAYLQEPDYVPAPIVDNTEYEKQMGGHRDAQGRLLKMETEQHVSHYHANMASLIQLGNWMDYLRENGVYDNTRIIIVADHGRVLHQMDEMIWGDANSCDAMAFNPLLMVKDFNSTGFTVDQRFMTHADTPSFAVSDLIQKPVNPFTGNPITSSGKKESPKILVTEWRVDKNNGNTFLPGSWYTVHDDIMDKSNWKDITDEMN